MYDNGKETFEIKHIKERRLECMQEFREFGGADFLLNDEYDELLHIYSKGEAGTVALNTYVPFGDN